MQWRDMGFDHGGWAVGLHVAQGIVFAETDTHGAYRRNPRTGRWDQLISAITVPAADLGEERFTDGCRSIGPAPGDPRRVYVYASNGRLYRTDDAFATAMIPTALPVVPSPRNATHELRRHVGNIAVSPTDANRLIVGTLKGRAYRSSDAGASFQEIPPKQIPDAPSGPGHQFWYHPHADGLILANVYGLGMIHSTDHGATWSAPEAGSPTRVYNGCWGPDGHWYGCHGRGIWRWNGYQWANLWTNGLDTDMVSVAVHPADPRLMYAVGSALGARVHRSVDGGARWTISRRRVVQIPPGQPGYLAEYLPHWMSPGTLLFRAERGVHELWMGEGFSVVRAQVDGRETDVVWRPDCLGIQQLVCNQVLGLPNGRFVTASWDLAVCAKDDASLAQVEAHQRPVAGEFGSAWSVATCEVAPEFVAAVMSDHQLQRPDRSGYSMDSGRTWKRFGKLPQPPAGTSPNLRHAFGCIAVSQRNPDNILWAPAMRLPLQYTLDRGETWRMARFDGIDPSIAARSGPNQAHYLKRHILACDREAAYLHHPGDAVAELRGLWRSGDGGANWTKVGQLPGALELHAMYNARLRSVPGRNGHLFFTCGHLDGVEQPAARSIDGGRTWEPLMRLTQIVDFGFGPVAGGYPTLYVAGQVDGRYGIHRSRDGARSWQLIGRYPHGVLHAVSGIDGSRLREGRVLVGFAGAGYVYSEELAGLPGMVFGDLTERFPLAD